MFTLDSFSLKDTNQYILSIQVSLDGFSFIVVDPDAKHVVAFKNEALKISSESFLAARLSEWIAAEPILQQQYKLTCVVFSGSRITLIPQELYQHDKSGLFMNLLYENKSNDTIIENDLDAHAKILLFTVPGLLKEKLEKQYQNIHFHHPLRQLAYNLPELHKQSDNGVILHLESKNFFILTYNKEQILFINHYSYQHPNDVTYYTLTVLKQMGITAGQTELGISGAVAPGEELESLLSRYFKSVNLLRPFSNIQYNPFWFNNQDHRYVVLFKV